MKPILVSGIQPTGKLHLGNYLGALKNFVELQNSGTYDCFFFIADLHSLTENYTPKEKKEQISDLFLTYLAAGLDPKKSVLFQQSAIAEHSELSWIFNTITPIGELETMTQFKDKAHLKIDEIEELIKHIRNASALYAEHNNFLGELNKRIEKETESERIESFKLYEKKTNEFKTKEEYLTENTENVLERIGETIEQRRSVICGLLTYPVLMAADILIYNASVVPVGNDQLQHLELTRTLARKFNSKFGKTFFEPKPLLTSVPRLMSLDDPEKKMSKSRPEGCLFIDDEPNVIRKKIQRAVTDSESTIEYSPEKRPGISNLVLIYSAIANKTPKEIVSLYKGKGYADFKRDLGDKLVETFGPFQEKKKELKKKNIEAILEEGNKEAKKHASKSYEAIKKKVGLI